MKNPLREGPGKGDKPRSCHNTKFRKNWDSIKWINKAIDNTVKDLKDIEKMMKAREKRKK